jgi:hypothetical protein
MFMKIEAAPMLFLITILALVVLISQVAAGRDDAASEQVDQVEQPAIQLTGISLSGLPAAKAPAADIALLRSPIALERPVLPQR